MEPSASSSGPAPPVASPDGLGEPLVTTARLRPDAAYNWIYQTLVPDSSDAVGAFAYVLYKQEKIAFIRAVLATHNRSPSDAEMQAFHMQTCTQPRIDSYLKNAELLAQGFLNAGMKAQIERYETELRESVLSKGFASITAEMQARKSWAAWLREVIGNLGVNLATILLIGFLLGGYQALNKFNTNIERVANLPAGEGRPPPGSR